jgi:hypothetical protein
MKLSGMREAGLFMPTEAFPVTKWSLGILHGLVLCSGILDGPNRHPRILIPPDPRSGIPQILDLCSVSWTGGPFSAFEWEGSVLEHFAKPVLVHLARAAQSRVVRAHLPWPPNLGIVSTRLQVVPP